jgi:hypothetical protein
MTVDAGKHPGTTDFLREECRVWGVGLLQVLYCTVFVKSTCLDLTACPVFTVFIHSKPACASPHGSPHALVT